MTTLTHVRDTHNNINRCCDIIGLLGQAPRSWRVTGALKDPSVVGQVTHYLLTNIHTGQIVVTPARNLTNLY